MADYDRGDARIHRFENLIDGQFRPAANGGWIDSIDPATGEVWAQIPDGRKADVDAAVDAARRAFQGPWSKISAAQRAGMIRKVADLLPPLFDVLATIETRDNGKIVADTRGGDLPAVAQVLHYFAGASDKLHGETVDVSPLSLNYMQHVPFGVVGIIIPWNSPVSVFAAKVAAALAAGNTVVVKPPETASCSSLMFARLFEQAGFPPGVVNVVAGLGAEAGDAIAGHPDVRKLSFTGSTQTARAITRRSAEALKPLSFELGGKSANIVFADADLDAAAIGTTTLAIFNSAAGQSCIAGSRILLQRPIYDEMIERIVGVMKGIRLGDPMDQATQMGPIALDRQFDKVKSYLDLGRQEGGEVLWGGKVGGDLFDAGSSLAQGYFVQPTLFAGLDNDTRTAREEIFGPVACVMPFDEPEEAIAIANDSNYGLACGLWTNDLKRAHRTAAAVEAGAIWVNTYRRMHWAVPFGGFKDSGYGRDSGMESVRGYQQTKSVWVDLA